MKQFCRYWHENIKTAKGGFDMAVLIVTAFLACISVLCWLVHLPNPIEGLPFSRNLAGWFELFAITIFSAWCFLWLPFRRHEQQEKIIETLQKPTPSAPVMKMEILRPDGLDILTSRRTYRVKVKNSDPSKIIKNLRVSISEIKWPQSAEKPLNWSGIIFPYQLPEKGSPNNSLAHEIAGDSEKEFDLMFVELFHFRQRLISLAPFQPKETTPPSPSFFKSVDSKTRFNIEDLPEDNSKLIFTFKITGGDGDVDTLTESYILKVPVMLAETSVEKSVENINILCQDFNKYLPDFEKIEVANISTEKAELNARLEKMAGEIERKDGAIQSLQRQVNDRMRRKKIKDSLAGFRITIQNLTAQLHDITYFKYHDEIRQKYERDYLQMQNETYVFLNENIGRSEATTFVDDERIPKVQSVSNNVPDAFKERWAEKQFMLNRLKFASEEIEKSEEKMDRSDFVLPL